jgi:hypothetical protein
MMARSSQLRKATAAASARSDPKLKVFALAKLLMAGVGLFARAEHAAQAGDLLLRLAVADQIRR